MSGFRAQGLAALGAAPRRPRPSPTRGRGRGQHNLLAARVLFAAQRRHYWGSKSVSAGQLYREAGREGEGGRSETETERERETHKSDILDNTAGKPQAAINYPSSHVAAVALAGCGRLRSCPC